MAKAPFSDNIAEFMTETIRALDPRLQMRLMLSPASTHIRPPACGQIDRYTAFQAIPIVKSRNKIAMNE